MAKTKVNLKPLEMFAERLISQQKDVAVKNATLYAQQKMVRAFETSQYQRRTGNLDDSFLWIVCYNGEIKDSGFLFDTEQASKPRFRSGKSFKGRQEAKKFIANYQSKVKNGIEIVFASAMFYSGFLEEGTYRGVFQVLRGITNDLQNDFGMQNVSVNLFPINI